MGNSCVHCGGIHATTCPRIKAIEYNADGTVKRVEFMTPRDYTPIATTLPPGTTMLMGGGRGASVLGRATE
jgi:hypothetical protein